MKQIQFSLIKQIKIGRPAHFLCPHPHPLRPVTSHFLLPPFPKTGRHMCITPNKYSSVIIYWKITTLPVIIC